MYEILITTLVSLFVVTITGFITATGNNLLFKVKKYYNSRYTHIYVYKSYRQSWWLNKNVFYIDLCEYLLSNQEFMTNFMELRDSDKILISHSTESFIEHKYKDNVYKIFIRVDYETINYEKNKINIDYIDLYMTSSIKESSCIIKHFIDYVKEQIKIKRKNEEFKQKLYVNSSKGKDKELSWELHGVTNNKKMLEHIILDKNYNDEIKTDLDRFLYDRDWYIKRGVPWKFGYLLYGPPGTGKSSIILAISNYCKRHICYLRLNDIKDDESLIHAFKPPSGLNIDEVMFVLEDVDCASNKTHKRKEITKKEGESKGENKGETEKGGAIGILKNIIGENNDIIASNSFTLACLLNCIDGVFNSEGRMIIMTTNHIDKLDSALIRDGRVNARIHIDYCSAEQIQRFFKLFYDNKFEIPKDKLDIISDIIKKCPEKFTPAFISTLLTRNKDDPEKSVEAICNLT